MARNKQIDIFETVDLFEEEQLTTSKKNRTINNKKVEKKKYQPKNIKQKTL